MSPQRNPISNFNSDVRCVEIDFPLTSPQSRARVKRRESDLDFGKIFSALSEQIDEHVYIEWQIKFNEELSNYILWFYKSGFIRHDALRKLKSDLKRIPDNKMLDRVAKIECAAQSRKQSLNDIEFEVSQISYPKFIHRLREIDIFVEITIDERQFAVGVQPMFYLCTPITMLTATPLLIGRTCASNETARLTLNGSHADVLTGILKIFGILSHSYNQDILDIIDSTLCSPTESIH